MTNSKKNATTSRRGRRPGIGNTRQDILDAARRRFAQDGFTCTTIRNVATDSGVDAAQVMQFFRSKDELFANVMAIPNSALDKFSTVFEGAEDNLGERVIRAFLSAWEETPSESEPLLAMLRGAIVNENARVQLSDFIQCRLLKGTEAHLGTEAALRAGLVASLLVGLITSRQIIGVPLLISADKEQIINIVASAIQQILVP
jgi:AcrR family transcriptional regulator